MTDKNDTTNILLVMIGILLVIMIILIAAQVTLLSEVKAMVSELNNKIPEIVVVEKHTNTIPTTEETIHTEPTETTSEALSAPVSYETDNDVSQSDIEMLACVIYQEAGGDTHCDECRRRVADIVLNRVADDRFPNSIYEVLTQKSQYGKFSTTGIVWPSRADNPGEKNAVERAYRIAEEVLAGQHSDVYGEGYIWQATFKQGKEQFYCCGHWFGRS